MADPNFFIVGTTKGGTSTLHRWLEQHPQVFMPHRKEMHHFCTCPDRGVKAVRKRADYEAYFAGSVEFGIGEATPCYMYYRGVPNAILERYPESRILVSLRDPAERFWSHYLMNEVYLPTGLSADEIVDMNLRGEASTALNDLVGVGLYSDQLARFLSAFGRDRVFVTFLEEIASSPQVVSQNMQRFLGLDEFEIDTTERDKQYVEPRHRLGRIALRNPHVRSIGVALLPWRLRRFLRTRILGDPALKPEMSGELRARLHTIYKEDCSALEDQLGRPLPWNWFRDPEA